MRISDWSSDVCSSDLGRTRPAAVRGWAGAVAGAAVRDAVVPHAGGIRAALRHRARTRPRSRARGRRGLPRRGRREIGRASGRERVCQYVEISVVAVTFTTNTTQVYESRTQTD